jgi:hypothetical protein
MVFAVNLTHVGGLGHVIGGVVGGWFGVLLVIDLIKLCDSCIG